MVEFNPTHEIREDVDVVWQIPPSPKAILFLAHSGNGNPFTYWPPHPNVPQCTGTPEHKVVVKQALERGFAVIAGKSVTDGWETWPPTNIDTQNTVNILEAWRAEHGLDDLPLSALGTSCGGQFVSTLATAVKMHSQIIMISSGKPKALESAVAGEYPATLWVPMVKDERTFSGVKQNIEILKKKGIPCSIVEALPLEIHPHFFAEHIDELDNEKSAKLHSVFVEYGVVSEDNSLKRNVMKHDLEPYLRKAGLLPMEDDAQHQKDEEKLNEAKKLHLEGGSKHPGPPHGNGVGGRGPSPGGRGPLSTGRGRGAPGGRGHDAPKLGGGPAPCHPLANAVSNQLTVAVGNHTLTARCNTQVFAWLERKGWANVESQ